MEAHQREEEYSMTSVEDSTTNVKSELRKRGPRKVDAMDKKEPPNKEKKEKTRCLTEIEEEADDDDQVVEESTSGTGVEVYTEEEPAVTSPVTRGRRRPRKGVPRRAPL